MNEIKNIAIEIIIIKIGVKKLMFLILNFKSNSLIKYDNLVTKV
ncbi:MAG: hypothetical protein RSE41_06360 [Clostridia bacterium]